MPGDSQDPNDRDEVPPIPRRTAWWPRAIAEFMVIVIGVLVALAVDRWNADQEDRRLEQTYLASLAADLEQASDFITEIMLPRLAMCGMKPRVKSA